MSRLILGRTLSFRDDPGLVGEGEVVDFEEQGAVAIGDDGRIAWSGPRDRLPQGWRELPVDDHGRAIVTAGLIDAHVHFPQYRMLAAPGRDLLDWLQRFAFREEARYADPAHAVAAAEIFLDLLLAHGTTAAAVYSTVHAGAAEALFAAAEARGLALATGKTLMDRSAPAGLLDDAETAARESEALIACWHGRGRLRYAVTPRFAITSSEAQLEACGALLRAHPGTLLQTHLSESEREIAEVHALFPWARDYTDVYDRHGLLGPASLFGHGVHLTERECARLSKTGSVVVHCPTSNSFLGSGLFDLARVGGPPDPVRLAIATDVGGGTSYSLLATLGEAHKVAQLRGRRLSPLYGLYLATLGNARALGLGDEIGSLAPGKWADLVVLDPAATPVMAARQGLSESLADELFALMILGDDRAVAATYVAGRQLYRRDC